MQIVKDSYVVLSYEDGWYHFYIHENNKPNTDECIKSNYTILKNADIYISDGWLEVLGNEYIKNGEERDSEVQRHLIYSGNFKIHLK